MLISQNQNRIDSLLLFKDKKKKSIEKFLLRSQHQDFSMTFINLCKKKKEHEI